MRKIVFKCFGIRMPGSAKICRPFEFWTSPEFGRSLYLNDHWPRIKIRLKDEYTLKRNLNTYLYNECPTTRHPNSGTIKFLDKFTSGFIFTMTLFGCHLVLTIQKQDKNCLEFRPCLEN